MAEAGYRNVHEGGIRVWRVVLYRHSDSASVTDTDGSDRTRGLVDRVIGLADEPTDDDDLRLRKRVGVVVAGYILVIGPLQLPLLAQGLPLSWFVAVTMPLVSAIEPPRAGPHPPLRRYVNVLVVMRPGRSRP